MSDGFKRWLSVLGLEAGASEQAIKEAYRDLVKVWHPDRFGTDERLRRKAEETLAEVNAAYEHLRNYRPSSPFAARTSPASPATTVQPPGSTQWSTDGVSVRDARAAHPWRMVGVVVLCATIGSAGVSLYLNARHLADAPSNPSEPEQAPASTTADRPASAAPHVAKQRSPVASADDSAGPPATTGSLRVDSRPEGGRVSFDGNVIGETPLRVTAIVPGEHQIRIDVDAKGYEPWTSPVVVEAGREGKVLAVMSRTQVSGRSGR